MGELLAHAALNAVIGIGTVFAVLLLICLIIYCFNIFPYLEKKLSKAPETPVMPTVKAPAKAPVTVAPAVVDEVPVAVIAAAIAAYEESNGYTGTGFYVRSIKRRK